MHRGHTDRSVRRPEIVQAWLLDPKPFAMHVQQSDIVVMLVQAEQVREFIYHPPIQ